jgi:hypothetical protein
MPARAHPDDIAAAGYGGGREAELRAAASAIDAVADRLRRELRMQSDFFWKDKVPSAVEIRRAAKKRYAELVESLVLARAEVSDAHTARLEVLVRIQAGVPVEPKARALASAALREAVENLDLAAGAAALGRRAVERAEAALLAERGDAMAAD